jgi:hypothetical protein
METPGKIRLALRMHWVSEFFIDQVTLFGYRLPAWEVAVAAVVLLLLLWAWSSLKTPY